MAAGGHVERDETPAEAAVREALEEAGLAVRLLPGPATPPPAGYPHPRPPGPWWTSEAPASADRYTGERHVHLDHLYLAIAPSDVPAREPEHEVRWLTEAELTTAGDVSEDSRLQAAAAFAVITGQAPPPVAPSPVAGPGGTGSGDTRLVIVRGNSATGKSTVAAGIRERHGRGLAVVGQDNLRRVVLRERDKPGGASIALIGLTARHALDHGFHVVVEGILRADYYGDMLAALRRDHAGITCMYYLDAPFGETLRRHAGKPQAAEYGEAEMRDWYRELDLLPGGIEHVIPARMTLEDTVGRIMTDAGL